MDDCTPLVDETTTTTTTAGGATADDGANGVVLGVQIDTRTTGGHVSFYRNNHLIYSFDNLADHPSMHLLRGGGSAASTQSPQVPSVGDGAEDRRRDSGSRDAGVGVGGAAEGEDAAIGEENKTRGVRPFVCFESPNDSVVFLGTSSLPAIYLSYSIFGCLAATTNADIANTANIACSLLLMLFLYCCR